MWFFSMLTRHFQDQAKSFLYPIIRLEKKNATIVNLSEYQTTVTQITAVLYTNQPIATAKIAKIKVFT